jgi:uncharacterized membrane protein YphA (DoxX/SURF4 family)
MIVQKIVTWVLSGLLALAFCGAGLSKLTGQAMMVHEFSLFGFPLWFMYLTGVIEIAGAVLVLVPRFAYVGAAALVCVMAGAVFSHLTHGQAGMIGVPLVLLILAAVVGTLRGWGQVSRLTVRNA